MVRDSVASKCLEKLWWREAWFTFEATDPTSLPPYLGSTIRGALGHLLRAALCEGPGCGHDCQRPTTCRYYSLFERNSEGAKPFVLVAPPLTGLEEIAMGGPITLPYRTGAPHFGESLPALRCEARWKFDLGGTLRFGLRVLGPLSNIVPAVIEGMARFGLAVGGTRFSLASARDFSDRLLYDRRFPAIPVQLPERQRLAIDEEKARRVKITFLSPAVFKLGRVVTFSPEDFAARFFEHSIGRAVQTYQTCVGTRLPWVEAPAIRIELTGHRLFHYELPRHSYRQDKRLDFDGVVGCLDLTGDFSAVMPWARAAEVLHFGQKATFGLGQVRVFVLQ